MSQFRIAFDTTKMLTTHTGVRTFSKNVLEYLQRQEDVEVVTLHQKLRRYKQDFPGKLRYHFDQFFWLHSSLPLKTELAKVDVLFSPEVAVPFYHRTPAVAVVHDMLMRLYPQAVGKGGRIFHHYFLEETLRFADRIICGSEETRRDLLKLIPVNPAKVSVIYYAASDDFRPLPHDDEFKHYLGERHKLTYQKYILMVGARHKRKNHVTLVAAYAKLRQNPEFADYKLVLVGPPGLSLNADSTPLINDLIKQHGLEDWVVILNNLTDPEVVKVYNGAAIFAYPSEAEGFGLPLLEAMQCGIPVISSRSSVMPEVGGEAPLYYDNPLDSTALAHCLAEALSNPDLLAKMRHKGLERATHFSWEKTGQQTLAVLREAAAKPSKKKF
jgi:glycosyltransferase involved in cell wall biosynthesis